MKRKKRGPCSKNEPQTFKPAFQRFLKACRPAITSHPSTLLSPSVVGRAKLREWKVGGSHWSPSLLLQRRKLRLREVDDGFWWLPRRAEERWGRGNTSLCCSHSVGKELALSRPPLPH